MNFTRKICLCLLAGAMCLLLTACSYDSPSRRANVDISRHAVVYKFEEVDRNKPEVHIYPVDAAIYPPNALMLPFPVTQAMSPREFDSVSKGLTRILWQAMVKEEAFPILEYVENVRTYSLTQALNLARAKGADVIVTGSIPYMITGGSTGLNQLVVHVEVYDVLNGELLWSITHSGGLDEKPSQDFIFFKGRSKLPADAMYVLAMALGSDIGQILHDWSNASEGEEARSPELDGGPRPESGPPAF